MIPPLRLELTRIAERESARRWHEHLAKFWGIAAAAALCLLALRIVLPSAWPAFLLAIAAGIGWLSLRRWHDKHRPDLREIARAVEKAHPELHTALLAALDQRPDDRQRFTYLQTRVIDAALDSARGWGDVVPAREVQRRRLLQYLAAALAAIAFIALLGVDVSQRVAAARIASMLDVQPGSAEIERGSPVTFTARFQKNLPPGATLHLTDSDGRSQDLPLSRTLEDPVFTASLPSVSKDLSYRVDFGTGSSREFQIRVYDPPRVEQVDAQLHFPAYTGQPDASLKDTRSVAAIEQTKLTLQVRTNTPMRSAELRSKDGGKTIPLERDAKNPDLYTATFPLEQGGQFEIALADEAGRPNARTERFDIKVSPNKPPVVTAKIPGKKDRATALQELSIEAQVEDDFGLNAAGLVVQIAGGEPQKIDAPRPKPGARSIPLTHLVKLENLGVKPNDLIIWNAWGEDIGPDGKPRRTNGDVHITPVRFFDESSQQRESVGGQPGEEPDGIQQLIRLQTDILSGTWNVQRDSQPGEPPAKDMATLKDSQSSALETARNIEQMIDDPEMLGHMKQAGNAMQSAADRLAKGGAADLPPAIGSEQTALAQLYQLMSNRNIYEQPKSSSQSQSREDSEPRDEIDLKNMQQRYEQETAAEDATDQRGRDVQEALNRLRDLAQRQRDLNEEMNRLQLALRNAASDEERAALQRELQRLRDQQQELLADADKARQEMNEKNLSQQQQTELDKARQAAEQAARKLDTKQLGDALAEGSRAQREFEQAHEAFRQETAGELSQQLRQLREQAHALSERQQQIGEDLAKSGDEPEHRTLGDEPDTLAARTQQQAQDFEKFMDAVSNTARLAAEDEPLVSQRLDSAARDSHPERIQQALDAIKSQVAANDAASTADARKAAEDGLQTLQQRIDEATSKVLGSEAQALQYARAEIEQLRKQVMPGDSQQPDDQQGSQQGQQGSQQGQQGNQQGQQGSQQGQQGSQQGQQGNQPGQQSQGDGNGRTNQQPRNASGVGMAPTNRASQPAQGGGIGGSSSTGGIFINPSDLQAWSNRMQEVESAVDIPSVRDALARARSNARDIRIETKRLSTFPNQTMVEDKILRPLLDAEKQINRALSELDHKNPLAPVEHDPVPDSYSEAVQRYYESLGQ